MGLLLGKGHLYRTDEVLRFVRLHVGMHCSKNFKFIGHLMQDTSSWDSYRFHDEWLSGANSERTCCTK